MSFDELLLVNTIDDQLEKRNGVQITEEIQKKTKEQISKDREEGSENVVSAIVDETHLMMG